MTEPRWLALFDQLVQAGNDELAGEEACTYWIEAENSDFVRFNHGRVRQAGTVAQGRLRIELIQGFPDEARHAACALTLTGDPSVDEPNVRREIEYLRGLLPELPVDPHFLVSTASDGSETIAPHAPPNTAEIVDRIGEEASDLDFVGFLAAGAIHRGFASSWGQRDWFSDHNFNLDWSVYLRADKAVKASYAGSHWRSEGFGQRINACRDQLRLLAREPRNIDPGSYRVYLAPAAVYELLTLLCWDGFGLKSLRSKQSPLQRLADDDEHWHGGVHLSERADGSAPGFGPTGFRRPAHVALVSQGRHRGSLVSPRSAKEFGVDPNGANDRESPCGLHLDSGEVADPLAALGSGIYVSDLWYLNYSHRPTGKLTGMTRFATAWVDQGRPVAPLTPMRFDDTLSNILGERLQGLGETAELRMSTDTYGCRSTESMRVPGLLIDGLRFTL